MQQLCVTSATQGGLHNYNERFSSPSSIQYYISDEGNGYKVDDKNNWLRLKCKGKRKRKKEKKIIIIPSHIAAALIFIRIFRLCLYFFFFLFTSQQRWWNEANSLHYLQLISPPPGLPARPFRSVKKDNNKILKKKRKMQKWS
jgi:hypothetical protein